MKRLSLGALAISLMIAAPAMAQRAPSAMPSSAMPSSTMPGGPADPATAPAVDARTAGSDASVTVGMPVKDNAGVTIGTVNSVQPGPNGAPTATIKMGDKVFSVGTDALAVSGGTATVNASQAQIQSMLPK